MISSEAVMNGAMLNVSKVGVAARGKCNNAPFNTWDQGHTTSGAFAGVDFRESSFQTAKNIKR